MSKRPKQFCSYRLKAWTSRRAAAEQHTGIAVCQRQVPEARLPPECLLVHIRFQSTNDEIFKAQIAQFLRCDDLLVQVMQHQECHTNRKLIIVIQQFPGFHDNEIGLHIPVDHDRRLDPAHRRILRIFLCRDHTVAHHFHIITQRMFGTRHPRLNEIPVTQSVLVGDPAEVPRTEIALA